jgi:hypothetical protein
LPNVVAEYAHVCFKTLTFSGWHPDVNAQASVKSHARNFMMHFSLFIALQDTTPKMGKDKFSQWVCERVENQLSILTSAITNI